jgi:uncharacterized protein YjiS (DUF1127 family)
MMNKSIARGQSSPINLDRWIWDIHQYALTWLSRMHKWRRNAKTRRHLAQLPPYLYHDIGLTEHQIRHEIQKKFWR